MWVTLQVFYNSSPALSITEAVHDMHGGMYLIRVRHFGYPVVLSYDTDTATLYKQELGASALY
jgi:hypothetical protein